MSWLDKLRELLEASDLRVTFDSERDNTKPCWCCGRADVPRELVQIGHYLNPHRDSMVRPQMTSENQQRSSRRRKDIMPEYKEFCLSRVLVPDVPDKNKHTYWLSFCDPNKPEGERFLGCIMIDATDFIDAIRASWQLAINPGGEVQGVIMPNTLKIDPAWKQRLLTRDECKELEAELCKQQN